MRQDHERFFRELLGDIDEPTTPFGLTEVHRDGGLVTGAQEILPQRLNAQLRAHARGLGVSLASLCHLAWAQVMARTSGRTTVVFGTVLFGRRPASAGADQDMGLFINALPLRLNLDETGTEECVRQTHGRLTELLCHKHASLALAKHCSKVVAPAPLFSALLDYRDNPKSSTAEKISSHDSLHEVEWLGGEERTHYPVTLSVEDFGHSLGLTAQILAPFSPERLCGYMQHALEQLVATLEHAPHTPIRRLEVLPAEERTLLLQTWNQTEAPYPQHLCIHQLFEQQVERAPQATAVIYEQLSLTYRDLNAQANRLAHHLIALGVRPDEPVALCLERSPAMIIGLLAILKAGGAYVPLDPAYPSQRLVQILTDAAPRILLCDTAGRNALSQYNSLQSLTVLALDTPQAPGSELPQINPDPHALCLNSRHLAYIIYTSGSTGTPKGVMVEHYNACNYLCWAGRAYGSQRGSIVSSSFAFDATVTSLYTPLLQGGAITLLTKLEELDTLKRLISQQKSPSLVKITPTALDLLADRFDATERVEMGNQFIVGGESLAFSRVLWCFGPGPRAMLIM